MTSGLPDRFAIPYRCTAEPPAADGKPQERVIRGRLDLPAGAGPHPLVLCCHGHTSFCDWGFYPHLAAELQRRGIACLRFNFSGSGIGADLCTPDQPEVFARNSYLHELADLERLRAELTQRADPRLDLGRLGILGHSRGAGMALIHAAEQGDYRSVVLWAPLPEILQFSPERIAAWRAQGQLGVMHWTLGRRLPQHVEVLEAALRHRRRLDIPAAAARLAAPLLCIAGGRDRSIPVDAIRGLCAMRAGARLEVLADADHVFDCRHPQAMPLPDSTRRLLELSCAELSTHLTGVRRP